MRCPSCQRPVDHEADSCYSCGYSSLDAMKKFGSNQVQMQRVHDAADCLRVDDRRNISDAFDRLEDRFPQLLFAAYLGDLDGSMSIAELGFWLLNQAKIGSCEISRANDHGILLVMDVERREAGISLGYLPEMLLTESDCLKALLAGRSFFMNGDFGGGVMAIFKKLDKSLRKQARKMKGMTRGQKQSLMMKTHHGPNALIVPGPGVPVQFDSNAAHVNQVDERRQECLMFRNEFESERE